MRVISAVDAAGLVKSGDALWIGGSGSGHAVPQRFIDELADRYQREQQPTGLTTVSVVGVGDFGSKGLSQLALPGLNARVICSNIGNAPALGELIARNEVAGYSLPQGVLAELCREGAARRPGLVTDIGLGTYVDPRLGGGRLNALASEELVELVELCGQEWLFFHRLPVDVAVLRATTADEDGNLTMEREPILADSLPLAMAAHNSGGTVIAQVQHVAARGSLRQREVRVPGALVDYVFTDPDEPQTYETAYSPFYAGQLRVPSEGVGSSDLDVRKLIARRSFMEFRPGDVCNLGFGISQQIGAIAAEEGVADLLTLTIEQGLFGGSPAFGQDGGAAVNYSAMIEHASMFDFYDGGGLDIASLSFAEVDQAGNVNVHAFQGPPRGPGGFPNISARTGRLCFVGTFTAKGFDATVEGGRLVIRRDGDVPKFVPEVREISFSGRIAREREQHVRYVTERAVFELSDGEVQLIEIADGIDLERDIFAKMGFRPRVSSDLRTMDKRLFESGRIGLVHEFLGGAVAGESGG